MDGKSSCLARSQPWRAERRAALSAFALGWLALEPVAAVAAAPDWLQSLASAPTPAHEDEADAVLLYSETILSVAASGRLRRTERTAYRILRPDGSRVGVIRAPFGVHTPVTGVRGWSIPPAGAYFEVKDRDAIDSVYSGVAGAELVPDLHIKWLRIPGATPGSIVGREIVRDEPPGSLNDEWVIQGSFAVGEAHYSLELPAGWEYRATWINHAAVAPVASGNHRLEWSVSALPAIAAEESMPPARGLSARMVLAVQGPGGRPHGWVTWADVGAWYSELTRDREDVSPAIQQKVAELTAPEASTLGKIRVITRFVQSEVRYVAVDFGVSGPQPHTAAEVLGRRYGDANDKSTLLGAMLKSIDVASYYVLTNRVRGAIAAGSPPQLGFDHVILAIALPTDAIDPLLLAAGTSREHGTLVYFDPTDARAPLGSLPGPLQASYGLLVSGSGGELVPLPQLAAQTSTLSRVGTFTLDGNGLLSGDVRELRTGDRANAHRAQLQSVARTEDRIRPIETAIAQAVAGFSITKAAVGNVNALEQPLEWRYSIEAPHYAQLTGGSLLVRPRVFGEKSSALLERKDARQNPIEFDGPLRDSDTFTITLPAGFRVDELPPPVHLDYDFGSYRSETEIIGGALRYTRVMQIKQLSVPAERANELRDFYRAITRDERSTVVLVKTAH